MYLICNIYVKNKISDLNFQRGVLKTAAYHSKTVDPFSKEITYKYVLIPYLAYEYEDTEDFRLFCQTHVGNANGKDVQDLFSIYKYLIEHNSETFSVTFVSKLDDKNVDVFYTDGSSSKNTGKAGYGVVKILNHTPVESISINSDTDSFTTFSGSVNDGTNNIGELTGLKVAIENEGDSEFQLIISDSEYTLKSFREWIYNWRNTNYIGSNKKEVLNKQLIMDIDNLLTNSNKMYIFKWTKGHSKIKTKDSEFNCLCDELAKQGSGIL